MSETLVIAEPGSWLTEHQRARCTGETPLATFQGMLADEIVLPQSAAVHPDPMQIVLACNAWVEAMTGQAFLIAGEFAPEALASYYAHDYVEQAKAGGHGPYFAVRQSDELALKCARAGLKSMLADPHLEIYDLALRLDRAPAKTARKLARQNGYRNLPAALKGLDQKLIALEAAEPLAARQKAWLKSLRKLKIAPDGQMSAQLVRIAGLNRLREARIEEAARIAAAQGREHPAFAAAKALCDMAGLRFAGLGAGAFGRMRSIWPEGPDRAAFIIRLETHRGPRPAAFYREGRLFGSWLAVLLEPGQPLPIGSLKLSKAEYAAIVPSASR